MAILSNHRDAPEHMLARSAQEDPWVMYLVVHQTPVVRLHELLLATTEATMRCVQRHADTDRWRASFGEWASRSFRKVSLRARGAAWEKLAGYDHGDGTARGAPLVRALPPITKSARDALLRNLQAFTAAPESFEAPTVEAPADPDAMVFVMNPAAVMSPGKQVAQIAHAVLMCAWSDLARDPRHAEAFGRWEAKGFPGAIVSSERWAALRASGEGVVVRDAGLTEVTPGTETVMALAPGSAPRSASDSSEAGE